MKKNDLISIIVPIYNSELYLEQCIESIINQSYGNLEIILVDDGSTDNSLLICQKYAEIDKRIIVVSKQNGGVSSARNKGIELANGKFISFIDSDDFVNSNYISKMYLKCLNDGSDLVFCKYSRYYGEQNVDVEEEIPEFLSVEYNDSLFLSFFYKFFQLNNNIFGSCCRLLINQRILKNIRFNEYITVSEDLLFVANLILNSNSISCVDEHLYYYRIYLQSNSRAYKRKYINSQLQLYNELKQLFGLLDDKKSRKVFNLYGCLMCYYVFSNEIVHKSSEMKEVFKTVKNSVLYSHFTLKNGLQLYTLNLKLKFIFVWFFIKVRLL
ncbi:MAG: glycosyltransferase family 2 protein [Bacilli bacterium]|nr:glycosyltransferase family 2 protein [Bacilli bacterium]